MPSPPLTVYGIPNCDTVKRARAWLSARGAPATFHDFKKLGVPEPQLDAWLATAGWQRLLNRKGTTWRKLEPGAQAAVVDSAIARALMLAQPDQTPGGGLAGRQPHGRVRRGRVQPTALSRAAGAGLATTASSRNAALWILPAGVIGRLSRSST